MTKKQEKKRYAIAFIGNSDLEVAGVYEYVAKDDNKKEKKWPDPWSPPDFENIKETIAKAGPLIKAMSQADKHPALQSIKTWHLIADQSGSDPIRRVNFERYGKWLGHFLPQASEIVLHHAQELVHDYKTIDYSKINEVLDKIIQIILENEASANPATLQQCKLVFLTSGGTPQMKVVFHLKVLMKSPVPTLLEVEEKTTEIRDTTTTIKEIAKSAPADSFLFRYYHQSRSTTDEDLEEFIGKNEAIMECKRKIFRYAPTDEPVLITGETGTGKELVAKLLHQNSQRKDTGLFIPINCGALPRELVESELFGHVKSAFTGAEQEKHGLFQQANKGTLFLDEIGDLPLDAQVKLLRVLQEKKVRPVGAGEEKEVDVRLITATNRNLPEMINEGKFRSDLYYRIALGRIDLPPLRERREDIPLLVKSILGSINTDNIKKYHRPEVGIDDDALRSICRHDWPGNVRELIFTLRRANLELAEGKTSIEANDIKAAIDRSLQPTLFRLPENLPEGFNLDRELARIELHCIELAMKFTAGNMTKAAPRLGLKSHQVLARRKTTAEKLLCLDGLAEDQDLASTSQI